METVDVIVIGSGQGGVPLAADFASSGRNVVLFERDALGGSCVNYGCTPSKAFLATAHGAGRARQASKLGVHAQLTIDFPTVMERVRSIRTQFNQGVKRRLDSAGVKVVCAEAAFTGERTVTGGGVTVQAPTVVINTGTSSSLPDFPGLAGTPYLTNRNFFDLQQLPPRLLVVGGGYIALELGQGIARLGSQTELIVRGDRLLAQEESDVSAVLAEAFQQDGIGLHFNTTIQQVAYANGVFTLMLNNGNKIDGEALLERGKIHDESKFIPPERLPYIWLTEFHRRRQNGEAFTYPNGVEEQVKAAIQHHVTTNRHHPEFHTSPDDMSDIDLIEMVCDWTAIAQELGENGGSARQWANKTIGNREHFNFGEANKQFIYQVIDDLDRHLRPS